VSNYYDHGNDVTFIDDDNECPDCGEDENACECDEMEAERMGLNYDEGRYDSDME
jgi:hypothetical protein